MEEIKVVPEGWAVIVTAQPSGTTLEEMLKFLSLGSLLSTYLLS